MPATTQRKRAVRPPLMLSPPLLPLLISALPIGAAALVGVPPPPPKARVSASDLGPAVAASSSIPPSSLTLGPTLGNGTFGTVRWGRLRGGGSASDLPASDPVGADDRLVVTKSARADVKNAVRYLETEGHLNRRLCLGGSSSRHVAPYLGDCVLGGERHLVWSACGNLTLHEYVLMDDGVALPRLADALGVPGDPQSDPHPLAREVLRQILSGLSYCHSRGIVHRDVKPANLLVDESVGSLRFIDFGSACDMAGWAHRRGYVPGRGPLSVLYCAPEEFVDETHPFAYDVFSAAVTWLRTVLPAFRGRSEDGLYDFRVAIRDARYDLRAWHEGAALSGSLPPGWEGFFASPDGRRAFRLLTSMLRYEPGLRPSASEAMLRSYLNPTCSEEAPWPKPPAVPWSVSSHLERWARAARPEECVIPSDMFGDVVLVELDRPVGLLLEGPGAPGVGPVAVGGMAEGGSAARSGLVRVGDELLAVGPIDVEGVGLDHVLEILERWPGPTVSLQFLRDRESA